MARGGRRPALGDRGGGRDGRGHFGPAEPDDAAAAQVWHLVAEARQAATAGLPLHCRAWVRLNPASLLTTRGRPRRAGGAVPGR